MIWLIGVYWKKISIYVCSWSYRNGITSCFVLEYPTKDPSASLHICLHIHNEVYNIHKYIQRYTRYVEGVHR